MEGPCDETASVATTTTPDLDRDRLGSSCTADTIGRQRSEKPLLVLKVGTATLLTPTISGYRVNLSNLARIVDLVGNLKRKGNEVVMVSSGAMGMGCIKLGITRPPTSLRTRKAVAAVGQSHLMRNYEDLFRSLRVQASQLLLTQTDFLEKDNWERVKETILESLAMGIVPIINENDSTNTEELRFGDNDNLAALTAVQLQADAFILFTDVDFLYTANPHKHPDALPIKVVDEPWSLQIKETKAASDNGVSIGGMHTKILAARTASAAGIPSVFLNGEHPERTHTVIDVVLNGGDPSTLEGTYFKPMMREKSLCETRRWILSLPAPASLVLEDGCIAELKKGNLYPNDIKKVLGTFQACEAVRLLRGNDEVGRALVNFGSAEMQLLRGQSVEDYEDILGFPTNTEACYNKNIILTSA